MPQSTAIQSLHFLKSHFNQAEAKKWAKLHGFHYGYVDETPHQYRIRQKDPNEFKAKSFRTITLRPGVQATVAKENPEEKTVIYTVTTQQGKKARITFTRNKQTNNLEAFVGGKHYDLGSTNNMVKSAESWIIDAFDVDKKDIQRKNMGHINLSQNPHYFPRSGRGRPGQKKKYKRLPEQVFDFGRGRPRKPVYWKADLFRADDSQIDAIIGQGTKESAFAEAQAMVGKLYKGNKVARVVLDGPFETIDDIPVTDNEEFEILEERTPDEREVMELAATMPRAPRGTVKFVPPVTTTGKKRGRKRIHSLTHKYKVGQIVLITLGSDKLRYAIVTQQLNKNKYYLNIFDEYGTHRSNEIVESNLRPLPKGRPSEYVKEIIAKLKASL